MTEQRPEQQPPSDSDDTARTGFARRWCRRWTARRRASADSDGIAAAVAGIVSSTPVP
jgi:hypothetical protein